MRPSVLRGVGLSFALVVAAGMPCGVFAESPAAQPAAQPAAGTKIPVKSADDLPRHTYKIEGKASEFISSDAPFKAFVTKMRADLESDLAKYEIADPATLKEYYTTLQQIAFFEGRDADVLALIEKARKVETKESKKLMSGQVVASLISARKTAGGDAAKLNEAFGKELATRVGALPWSVVREDVLAARGRAQMMSKDLVLGMLQGQLDPIVETQKGEISGELSRQLVSMRVGIDQILPLNPVIAQVYGKLADANVAEKANDIWTERLVTLTEKDKATPVVVCVWDSGVDVSLFSGQLWVNTKETANGKDDDGNGFVDDVNGIAFDLKSDRTPEVLHPADGFKNELSLVSSHTKGMMDLQANIDSKEAGALRQYVSTLKGEKVTEFMEDLGLYGNYSHGTHVAGIAAAGNPFAKLLPVRITFDYKSIPQIKPSKEGSEKIAASMRDAVAYMKSAGVRVVNMSWGEGLKGVEESLEKSGVGENKEERAKLAREWFAIGRTALDEAIKGAPEILFIAAAGNSDNDNTFADLIPSGLNQPNLITVGAVDSSGKPTGFTTFGKNVTLYANGFEVESYVPGGQRMKYSGTSMAAPNATNLAAKLFAINPKLTVAQAIELMRRGGDEMSGDQGKGRLIINPKKSVELLKAQK